MVSWPKGISAHGEIRRAPGHVIDMVPTLLELAGASPRAEAPRSPGQSLVSVFESDDSEEREALWWFHDGHKAIRMGDWKLVRQNLKNEKQPTLELYNLKEDPIETKNVAEAHPEILQKAADIFKAEREIPELENFKIPILQDGLLNEKK